MRKSGRGKGADGERVGEGEGMMREGGRGGGNGRNGWGRRRD